MPEKVRFFASLDPKTHAAIERVVRRHKLELPKSYIVEFALVRLRDSINPEQLTLSLGLDAVADASR